MSYSFVLSKVKYMINPLLLSISNSAEHIFVNSFLKTLCVIHFFIQYNHKSLQSKYINLQEGVSRTAVSKPLEIRWSKIGATLLT